jgi:hypothetical protein
VETPTPSDAGYPEEQPEEVAPEGGDTPQEDRAREGQGGEEATESGDGKATGNRRSAG